MSCRTSPRFAPGDCPVWESSVMQSLRPVIESSSHVQTSQEAVSSAASWMAFEGFEFPSTPIDGAFHIFTSAKELIDVYFFYALMNFAFSDFDTGEKFVTDYLGRQWSDSEAMFACVHRALRNGVPLREGGYWAEMTLSDLEEVFDGNIKLPMSSERVEILNEVGGTLQENYGGAAHRFVEDCAPALYAAGDGLLERLAAEFPRFADVSDYKGAEVQFYKLAQLFLWTLYMPLHSTGDFVLADLERMTAFADYILPVALQAMGILTYSPELEHAISSGEHIVAHGEAEVEIRSHTLYAMALLTEAVNRRRPPAAAVSVPQVDLRLWRAYHATFRPHHLTRTIMY